ncbi:MAG: BMP family ABC transporter substrate-binding protein [Caldisericum exile]|uniref:BMP family ABC transporter substrate-binding protein n=1 Tax=Caldisericum exile TaxID=693075 RepID=UPI003C70D403
MLKNKLKTLVVALVLLMLVFTSVSCSPQQTSQTTSQPQAQEKTIKAGFIYVGPTGDYGWTNAHDVARKQLEQKFPWLKTVYIESVPETDAGRYIDRLVNEEKCNIVFTTSFGFMDATAEAAKKYPNVIFEHCSGYKRDTNLGTYFSELYQAYYLTGLMAGALTKTNKIGYVAAHPIPEVIRHINAFAIGVKEANPKAKVYVRWLFSWYDPAKAKEAAESLISNGVDALAFTEDSTAVIDVGEEHTKKGQQIYTFSHYSPMLQYGPDTVVSGQLADWEPIYEDIIRRVYTNTWTNQDYWWLMKEGACKLGADFNTPINPKFVDALKAKFVNDPILGKISIYDLVMKREEQMSEPTVLFDPFTGPIYDQKGTLRLKPGERASHDLLWNINWFVDNVVGEIPK